MTPAHGSGPAGVWPPFLVAIAAGAWGLYWLPLRAMQDAGIPLAWIPALLYAVPTLLLVGLAWVRERPRLSPNAAVTGFLAGAALALYTDALLLTEVVRVLIFFYLTPVWSTLLERLVLGIRISGVRVASILTGFSGLGIAVGAGSEDFLARINIGDVLALLAGMAWAWATLRVYASRTREPLALSAWFVGMGALVGAALALFGLGEAAGGVDRTRVLEVMPWFVAFSVLVVTPTAFAMMWGAGMLAPGVVGILLMTEVTVGTVSAALWAGEPIGPRELIGISLVTLAGILEVGYGLLVRRR